MLRFTDKSKIVTKKLRRVLPLLAAALLLASCGKADNTDQEAYRTYGINCLNQGDYEEAVDAFQKALDCSDGSIDEIEIDIVLYKARAIYLTGDTQGALDVYTALIDYNNNAAAHFQRGNLYLCIGDYESALSDYDAAVAEEPKSYELYIGIYESLDAYDYHEVALSYLETASAVKGEKALDHLYKGRIAYLMEDYDTASDLLKKAVDQGEVEANLYLARICQNQGNTQDAMTYLTAYMESDLVTADALIDAGEIQAENGDYDSALTFYENAETMESLTEEDHARLLRDRALAYEAKLDFADACAALTDYCALCPDDTDAARELTFLQTR